MLTRLIPVRSLQIGCYGLLLCAPLIGHARATELPPSYLVGVEDVDYYPIFSATPPDYLYRGYARDPLDLFANHEHIHLTYVPLPARRLSHEFRAGRLDLIFPDNPRWEIKEKAQLTIAYSKPLLVFQDAMLVLPERLGEPLQNYRTLVQDRGHGGLVAVCRLVKQACRLPPGCNRESRHWQGQGSHAELFL